MGERCSFFDFEFLRGFYFSRPNPQLLLSIFLVLKVFFSFFGDNFIEVACLTLLNGYFRIDQAILYPSKGPNRITSRSFYKF